MRKVIHFQERYEKKKMKENKPKREKDFVYVKILFCLMMCVQKLI